MGVAFEGEDGIGGGEGIELAFADGLGDGFKFFASEAFEEIGEMFSEDGDVLGIGAERGIEVGRLAGILSAEFVGFDQARGFILLFEE